MRILVAVFALLLSSCADAGQAVSLRRNYSPVIVCAGDSISTQYKPIQSALDSYPAALESLLKLGPAPLASVIQAGVPGDRSFMLLERFEKDVMSHQPDLVIILIGINNLHFTDPVESYKADLQAMVDRTRTALPKTQILMVSPFLMSRNGAELVGPAFNPTHFSLLPNYIEGMREVASRNKCSFLDMHAEFQRVLTYHPASYFGDESVHPSERGRLFLAQQIAGRLKF